MNQNTEIKEQPQWVVDLLNRLDKLEERVLSLETDTKYLFMLEDLDL